MKGRGGGGAEGGRSENRSAPFQTISERYPIEMTKILAASFLTWDVSETEPLTLQL